MERYRFIMGTFSIWHWLIVLLSLFLFLEQKLKNLGSIWWRGKGFKDGLKEEIRKKASLR